MRTDKYLKNDILHFLSWHSLFFSVIFFLLLLFLNWSIVDSHCSVSFRYTANISIFFQILVPGRLLPNPESSSLCCVAGPCCLSVFHAVACLSQSPHLSLPHFPFGDHVCPQYLWVYFCFVNKVISIILFLFLDSMYKR